MKTPPGNLFVVVPIYNEKASVVHMVIEDILHHASVRVVVIDDGSAVPFEYLGEDRRVIALRHCINRGKGAAVKTGIEYAKVQHADMCITFDGDGQHQGSDIEKFIEGVQAGSDVVLGYRSYVDGNMPLHKAIANTIGNIVTYMVCGMWVRDSQCGFRAFGKNALAHINTQADGYEYESEVIKEAHLHALQVTEVPVATCYSDYSSTKHARQSFSRGIKTFFNILLFHRSQ